MNIEIMSWSWCSSGCTVQCMTHPLLMGSRHVSVCPSVCRVCLSICISLLPFFPLLSPSYYPLSHTRTHTHTHTHTPPTYPLSVCIWVYLTPGICSSILYEKGACIWGLEMKDRARNFSDNISTYRCVAYNSITSKCIKYDHAVESRQSYPHWGE